jgi:hypothetical protein
VTPTGKSSVARSENGEETAVLAERILEQERSVAYRFDDAVTARLRAVGVAPGR